MNTVGLLTVVMNRYEDLAPAADGRVTVHERRQSSGGEEYVVLGPWVIALNKANRLWRDAAVFHSSSSYELVLTGGRSRCHWSGKVGVWRAGACSPGAGVNLHI